jgi:hypothetical protein
MPSVWLGNSTRGRGTMACRTTRGAPRMSTQMEPLHGGTILSSTHDATPIEIDSDIDHDRSMRNSVMLSTRESKFTARRPTMPWLRGCWSIKSPPSPQRYHRSQCACQIAPGNVGCNNSSGSCLCPGGQR